MGRSDVDVVVIFGGAGRTMVSEYVLVAVKTGFVESRTVKVWDAVPWLPLRGMPLMVCVAASHDSPLGKAGLTTGSQVRGAEPPDAVKVVSG